MNDDTANYASVEAQLKALIASRIESMAGEADYHDHLKNGILDLKASRDELWQVWKQHQEDTRKFAHALLTYEVPTVVAGELQVIPYTPPAAALPPPSQEIRPPAPPPNLRERTRQIAEMLAPPIINGRVNQLAKRVAG